MDIPLYCTSCDTRQNSGFSEYNELYHNFPRLQCKNCNMKSSLILPRRV